MKNETDYQRMFGVGPVGLLVTAIVWIVVPFLEKLWAIPKMVIHPLLRYGLLIMFIADAAYLLIGGLMTFNREGRGKEMIKSGPYQFVRHPVYSAIVYSITGGLAVGLYSWGLIVAVLPLSLFWSWLIGFEEHRLLEKFGLKYEQYRKKTGQFFPNFKALSEDIEKDRR